MIVQAFQALLSRYPEHSNFYTDASKSEDKVGAAFVFQEETKRYPLPTSTSVYSGEIFAILQAVKYITSHGIQKATLITDSLSSVETLEQRHQKLDEEFQLSKNRSIDKRKEETSTSNSFAVLATDQENYDMSEATPKVKSRARPPPKLCKTKSIDQPTTKC
ncbi:hypothetical protein JTB14_032079 [Gonioctena quinquepunctata]|nr:hypothetical protein JTB14_032079 [Gonioctena quinquepunctata]